MLPGFRFLFAAIVLSMSILVFGLGAAALLRAAHEQFASNPSWHAAAEASFAQQAEATRPVLAMLRVEPPRAEQKASDRVPAVNIPAIPAPAEPVAITPLPPEPENIAALKPQEPSLPEAAKPDLPVLENPASSEAAPAQTDALTLPPADSETQIAPTGHIAAEPGSPAANEAVPAATEASPAAASQPSVPASPEADIASTKIATLGSPAVTVETRPPAKIVSAMPDQSAIKKRLQARRAAQRRRMAARARQAQLRRPTRLLNSLSRRSLSRRRRHATAKLIADQAGPVATGGPSGRPHSAHEPS